MNIPDLTLTSTTSPDFPFHVAAVAMRKVKGEAKVAYDLVLAFDIESADGTSVVLPQTLAPNRGAMLAALHGDGACGASRQPNTEVKLSVSTLADSRPIPVLDGRSASIRKVSLAAAQKKAVVRYIVRMIGDRSSANSRAALRTTSAGASTRMW